MIEPTTTAGDKNSIYQMKRQENIKSLKNWTKISGVLFVLFLAWLWFDGILYFKFETEQVSAVVTETKWVPIGGKGYNMATKHNLLVHYEYSFQGKIYTGVQQVGKRIGKLNIDDLITVRILVRKPSISEIDTP